MARIVSPADEGALRGRTELGFRRRYGAEPHFYASAPGRANLIGEHTDYNEGFVLPFAIARRTGVAAAPRGDRRVRLFSAGIAAERIDGTARGVASMTTDVVARTDHAAVELDLDGLGVATTPRTQGWAHYVRGVVAECRAEGLDPGGFDAWIDSDVPVGAGLSSSAALEVALAGVIEALCGRVLDPVVKARACRRAEQRYAGVPCGIMDQMAACLACGGDLLLIDCRSESWRRVELPSSEVRIVVVDSELPHDLGGGEFARRVGECRLAAHLLGLGSLRDATSDSVEALRRGGHDRLYRRARHVVEENARTLAAVEAIEACDWTHLGKLMTQSHASARDLYEVSRPEMDSLVESMLADGAYGARMTGGGFGGCAVALVAAGACVKNRGSFAGDSLGRFGYT
ncbi:MAG: galactokinase [Deltaproteobacteria bacterium]|nr:galactokinase [Deltaproteobacteria bacterium]